jgi:hypothetical protein
VGAFILDSLIKQCIKNNTRVAVSAYVSFLSRFGYLVLLDSTPSRVGQGLHYQVLSLGQVFT